MNANSTSSHRRTETTFQPVAVIDVGSTSIRMAIAELSQAGSVRILESLQQAVNLGKDSFTNGVIERATVEQCVKALKAYRAKLNEYDIREANQVRIVATSAVREARNRLAFLDRIYVATGFEIEPIDETEVNRITYLGIQPYLQSEPALASARTMVVEVGGGNTELLVVQDGNVTFSHTYRLGSLRSRRALEAYQTSTADKTKIIESQIRKTVEQIRRDVEKEGALEMMALGGDIRFATTQLLPDWNPRLLARVSLEELEKLTRQILPLSEDEIVREHHLSFPDAETLGPALLTYVHLAKVFDLQSISVTSVTLRDGLLKELAVRDAWTDEFRSQIIRSAIDLGRRYHFDERHARHSADLARALFDALREEHHLGPRFEVILYVAALLHEIGLFVGDRSYHKHTLYLIRNSDIFGLGKRDLMLAALTARYHRRASPQPAHEGYSTLNREERVSVAKMAALLRTAIALDESRSQRIKEIHCTREDDKLVIRAPRAEDLSLEQLALRQRGSLFEEIFGLQVLLRRAR